MALFTVAAFVLLAGSCLANNEVAVRGSPASIEQFPSLVQVEIGVGRVWVQSCTGSIITSRHIISAAHCFHGRLATASLRRVRAGAGERGHSGQVSPVEKVTNHPNYGTRGLDADISIVQLLQGLVYDSTVNAVAIIGQGTVIPANLPVVHAGWGATAQQSILANRNVYRVDMLTTDHGSCVDRYNIEITVPEIPEIELPEITWPPQIPEITWPPQIPDINLPDINLPDINLPDINLPDINLPDIDISWPEHWPSLPDISWPPQIPDINLPEITWPPQIPDITLPDITLPDITLPESINIPIRVSENMFCSGLPASGGIAHDPRDAGGPIYYEGVLIGIVSFGSPATERFPLVSTLVSQYTNWIVATAVL